EQNTLRKIFTSPQHPYTKALLACRPVNHQRGERLPVVSDFMGTKSGRISNIEQGISNNEVKFLNSKIPQSTKEILLRSEHLSVWFPTHKTLFGKPQSFIKAVDDVSFEVYKGETLGLVGESGCGKTTLGRALLRLIEPTAGKIIYNNIDLTAKKREELRSLRKEVQIIFQDPDSSLKPRRPIGSA